MHIISKRSLREFWESHPDAKESLLSWYRDAKREVWRTPAEVKHRFPSASTLPGDRVVFEARGNRYRLVVRIDYRFRKVYVRFVGTHADYDRIDAREV